MSRAFVLDQMVSGLKFDDGRQTRNYLQKQLDSMWEEKKEKRADGATKREREAEKRWDNDTSVLKTG